MPSGERGEYNSEQLITSEPSLPKEILDELDAQAAEVKKRRSLKIVRPSTVRGPERQIDAENPKRTRNLIVRFEREEILRIYKKLREKGAHANQTSEGKQSEMLRLFRDHAQQLERNLDLLNEQLYKNIRPVTVDNEDIGHHVIPVAELSLPDNQRERDSEDVPYISFGGIATNYHQEAAIAMALALQGKRVYAIAHPGNDLAETPKDWAMSVRKDGTYRLQAKVLREVVKGLGLENFHMVGYSMGAGVALEAARDPEFSRAAKKIDAIEPLGFENLGLARLGYRFLGKEVVRVMRDPESKLKAFLSGNETAPIHMGSFMADAGTMSKEQFNTKDLAGLRPEGNLRIWVMNKSTMVNAGMVREKIAAANELREGAAAEHPIEFYTVEGDAHAMPVTHANGFARMLVHGPGVSSDDEVSAASLDNSAARVLFRDVFNVEAKKGRS